MHAQRGAGLQDAWDLVALALTDEVCHGIGADQNLGRGAAALAPGQRQKLLGDDAAQHGGQLAADLVLRTGGADINNAVNGLGCTDRVQRAEDQMAGLGGGDGGGDRLIIAHLADQNDIRVLAQGAAQRRGKAARIRADLALVDERLPALIDILDGILDRDDVVAAGLVDMVDHRGQRGGLAAAGGAGDKDQTARLIRQLCQHGRHRQLCQRGDGIVEQAQRGRSPPLLEKDIYAAAGAVRCDQRKIGIDPLGKKGLAVRLIHQPKDQGAGLVSAHLHGGLHQPPVHPEHQGQPLGEMDVAGFHLPRQRGEFMDLHGEPRFSEKRVVAEGSLPQSLRDSPLAEGAKSPCLPLRGRWRACEPEGENPAVSCCFPVYSS